MKKIIVSALALSLTLLCILSCAIPAITTVSADHDCGGEGCFLCLVSAISSHISGRVLLIASAVNALLLSILRGTGMIHSAKSSVHENSPVYLKVKLLN